MRYVCTKCLVLKGETEFYNYKHSHRCKACKGEYAKSRNAVTQEQKREYNQRYYQENKGRLINDAKRYYEAHKDQHYANGRKWKERNPEKLKASIKKYNDTHKEKWAPYHAAWWKAHPEERRAKHRRRYYKYRERLIAKGADWQRRNPDKVLSYHHRRKAFEAGSLGSHTGEQLQALFAAQDGKCANPHCRIDIGGKDPRNGRSIRHLDHIVALSKGGSSDIVNLQWLCGPCNLSKHNREHEEWLEWYRRHKLKRA